MAAAPASPAFAAGGWRRCCAEAAPAISAAARAMTSVRLTMISPRKAAQRRGVSGAISMRSIASGLRSMPGAGISGASSCDRAIGSIGFNRTSGVSRFDAERQCRLDRRGLNRPVVHDGVAARRDAGTGPGVRTGVRGGIAGRIPAAPAACAPSAGDRGRCGQAGDGRVPTGRSDGRSTNWTAMTSTAAAATRPKANLGQSDGARGRACELERTRSAQVRARLGTHQVAHGAIDRRVERGIAERSIRHRRVPGPTSSPSTPGALPRRATSPCRPVCRG